MKTILEKTAAVLAFGIGVMALYAGGSAVRAVWPDLGAVKWLTTYNILLGLVTVLLVAPLIWKNSRWAMAAAASTLSVHALVLVFIQAIYQGPVSPDSIRAMTIRVGIWLLALGLMLTAQWLGAGKKTEKKAVLPEHKRAKPQAEDQT